MIIVLRTWGESRVLQGHTAGILDVLWSSREDSGENSAYAKTWRRTRVGLGGEKQDRKCQAEGPHVYEPRKAQAGLGASAWEKGTILAPSVCPPHHP